MKSIKILLSILTIPLGLWGLFQLYLNFDLYAQTGAATVVTAGDISPPNGGMNPLGTSNTVIQINPNTVLALGDNQYPDGTIESYNNVFNNTWGRFKAKIRPVPGNHEYHGRDAAGYYDYFGSLAGTRGLGYYSYNVGGWHLIALNSECDDPNAQTCVMATQLAWLQQDLQANQNVACTIAYWHNPRYSSGSHGDNAKSGPFWDRLYAAKADIVLAGHDHIYERFAQMNPAGQAVADGIRSFVVGTGGAGLYSFSSTRGVSQFKQNSQWGVLKLTLNPSNYAWQFIANGGQVLDSGTGNCVGGGGAATSGPTQPPITPNPTMQTSTTPTMGGRRPGDVDGNGSINILDFQALSNSFGRSQGQTGYNANANFNGDTTVNVLDFQILSNNFGR